MDFLAGGGEMGALMRGLDWSKTALGPPESWPASLRTVVRLILNTGHPMLIWWGPEFACLYNDACRRSIGSERHPGSLGRPGLEVWEETWDIVAPQIQQVISGGGPTWNVNQLVPMTRNGRREDVYWTYSYSPIHEETAPGGVGGVLVVCTETTEQVLAARRRVDEAERQRRLFMQAPGFITILRGPEHVFEFVNIAYTNLFGDRGYVGKTVREAFPDLEGQGFFERLDAVYATGERFEARQIPVRLRKPAEAVRRLDFIYEPVIDETGAVTGIFCEGYDVTQAHVAQEDLRASEEQLRLATDAAEVGLWDLDPASDTLYWPARVKRMFGISADATVSMDDFYACLHPEDRERVSLAFAAAVDARTRALYDVEYRTVGKEDGLVRWVAAKGRGRFDAEGRCVRVIGTAIDVTARKQIEHALQESEARLRALTDNLPSGMIYQLSTGADGTDRRFLYVSQSHERLTGVPAEAVFADPTLPYSLILEEDREGLAAAEMRAIQSLGPFDAEARIRRADGEIRWTRIISAPRRQPDGSIIWDGIQVDVTEQKKALADLRELNESLEQHILTEVEKRVRVEEALRQAQKLEAMGQLTGGVAHDFNNLLTPIIGSLDMLVRRGVGSERERKLIDGALQSAERAKTLVQRLLAFARRQPLQPTAVDVGSVIQGMADLVASTTGPQIKVSVEIDDDLPLARADLNQLEMALLNLSVNARDAMPDGGTLRISATPDALAEDNILALRPGRYVRISVADTGTGMDDETRARAIEPFFSTKGVGRGTGLGLSMVHGLASQLDGALSIQSRVGLGTNVQLWLPVSAERRTALSPAARNSQSVTISGTVLLVDDEALVRASTAHMLNELGYAVHEVGSAEKALALLREGLRPDLVVTDHLMPGMTGTDLAARIRETWPQTPILLVSGYAEVESLSPDLPRLTKPFRISDLAESIGALRRAAGA